MRLHTARRHVQASGDVKKRTEDWARSRLVVLLGACSCLACGTFQSELAGGEDWEAAHGRLARRNSTASLTSAAALSSTSTSLDLDSDDDPTASVYTCSSKTVACANDVFAAAALRRLQAFGATTAIFAKGLRKIDANGPDYQQQKLGLAYYAVNGFSIDDVGKSKKVDKQNGAEGGIEGGIGRSSSLRSSSSSSSKKLVDDEDEEDEEVSEAVEGDGGDEGSVSDGTGDGEFEEDNEEDEDHKEDEEDEEEEEDEDLQ